MTPILSPLCVGQTLGSGKGSMSTLRVAQLCLLMKQRIINFKKNSFQRICLQTLSLFQLNALSVFKKRRKGKQAQKMCKYLCVDGLISRGGGGTLVLFVVRDVPFFRGTFFKPLRNYEYHFHNFLTFHGIMGGLFRGFFIISGIMAQIFIRFVELWP